MTSMILKRRLGRVAIAAVLAAGVTMGGAAQARARGADATAWLGGIYQAIGDSDEPVHGRHNRGSPEAVEPAPAFPPAARTQTDPLDECLPIGPFRMMARDDLKMEIVPQQDRIVMLFEALALGNLRIIHLDRDHLAGAKATWEGDTVGRWRGDVLTLDSVDFNDRTWLNGKGVRHSGALHLVETLRPLDGGNVIEYTMTASDPKALKSSYTYIRYLRRTDREFADVACEQHYASGADSP